MIIGVWEAGLPALDVGVTVLQTGSLEEHWNEMTMESTRKWQDAGVDDPVSHQYW